jgi:hydroxymethylbilane synthase
MDGGCQVPIGALVRERGAQYVLDGFIGDELGSVVVRGEQVVDAADPERSGRALAAAIRSRGGEELVRRIRGMHGVPSPQPE